MQSDLADLDSPSTVSASNDDAAEELPTAGVSGEIRLPPGGRAAFLADLRSTLQELFARHGGADGEAFRLAVACYRKPPEHHEENHAPE